jgi:hypothetical protein
MNIILRVIKAIYNFLVGDMIILVGICIAVVVLALITIIGGFNPQKPLSGFYGIILIIAVLGTLTATLAREAMGKR